MFLSFHCWLFLSQFCIMIDIKLSHMSCFYVAVTADRKSFYKECYQNKYMRINIRPFIQKPCEQVSPQGR